MRSGRGRGKDRAGMDARWGIGSCRGEETSGVGTHLDFHLLVRGHVAHSARRVRADLNRNFSRGAFLVSEERSMRARARRRE